MTTQETQHLAAMTVYAADLACGYPTATPEALADKLLTVWTGSTRETRLCVARTAIRAVAAAQEAA